MLRSRVLWRYSMGWAPKVKERGIPALCKHFSKGPHAVEYDLTFAHPFKIN
jgi:hypothetical protein